MRNLIFKYEKIELLVCIYEISRGLVCKYWISKTTKPTVMLVIFVLHLNPTFVGNIFYSVWKYTSNKYPTKDFVHKKLAYLFLEAPWDQLWSEVNTWFFHRVVWHAFACPLKHWFLERHMYYHSYTGAFNPSVMGWSIMLVVLTKDYLMKNLS